MMEDKQDTCRKCGGKMIYSKALEQSYSGTPDFPGGDMRGATMSPDGRAVLIRCRKCEACGWQVTK